MTTLTDGRKRGSTRQDRAGLRARHMLSVLARRGALSQRDLESALGWPASWVGSCLVRLRQSGEVVLLRQRRPERISNGSGIKTLQRKIYGLPSPDVPFEPYEKVIRAPRSGDLGASVAPLKRTWRPRTKSGSGVVAPAPYARGCLWGAGW